MSARKIIQIATSSSSSADGDEIENLYALCDDGTFWAWDYKERAWVEMQDVPQPKDGKGSKDRK
jgi:hypothetical protein